MPRSRAASNTRRAAQALPCYRVNGTGRIRSDMSSPQTRRDRPCRRQGHADEIRSAEKSCIESRGGPWSVMCWTQWRRWRRRRAPVVVLAPGMDRVVPENRRCGPSRSSRSRSAPGTLRSPLYRSCRISSRPARWTMSLVLFGDTPLLTTPTLAAAARRAGTVIPRPPSSCLACGRPIPAPMDG